MTMELRVFSRQAWSSRALVGSAVLAVFLMTACGGAKGPSAEEVVAGAGLFRKTCASCHGEDAQGLPGQGKSLHHNEFVGSKSDEELLGFFLVGRRAGDPLNTTNVDIPPRGGNPALKDEDLKLIAAFVRSLQ